MLQMPIQAMFEIALRRHERRAQVRGGGLQPEQRDEERDTQEPRKSASQSKPRNKGDEKPARGRGGRNRRDDDEVIPAGEWNGPKC